MDERRLDWEEVLTRRADVDSVEWFTEAEMNEVSLRSYMLVVSGIVSHQL